MPQLPSLNVDNLTWKERFNDFTEFLKSSGLQNITIKNYQSDLKTFKEWFDAFYQKAFEPSTITSDTLEQYRNFLIENREFMPQSINRKLSTLRRFISWGSQTGIFPEPNSIRTPNGLKVKPQTIRSLNTEEQTLLLSLIEQGGNPRDAAIAKLLLFTGMRVSELCNLRWSCIHISASEAYVVIQGEKAGISREVYLNQEAQSALLAIGYKEHRGSESPVFVGKRGCITSNGIQSMFKRYVANTVLEGVTPIVLRHTFLEKLLKTNTHTMTISALMGQTPQTTSSYLEVLVSAIPSRSGLEVFLELKTSCKEELRNSPLDEDCVLG